MNEPTTAIALISESIKSQKFQDQIQQVLPPGLDRDRFTRTTLVALQNNPGILQDCDRTSLYNSIVRAATDGLLPDGREGAIVMFSTKNGRKAQWMPMVAGIIKRLAQARITIDSQIVCEKDQFEQSFGDDQKIVHRPPPLGKQRGVIIGVYAIAKMENGTVMREVMDIEQIDKVRASSRAAADGPWAYWYEEMARKTVMRRLAKRLPILDMSVQDTISADDEMYELDPKKDEKVTPAPEERPSALRKVVEAAPVHTGPPPSVTDPVAMREPGSDDGDIM